MCIVLLYVILFIVLKKFTHNDRAKPCSSPRISLQSVLSFIRYSGSITDQSYRPHFLCYCHSRFMSLYSSSYHSEVRNKLLFYPVVFFPSPFLQYPFIFIRVLFDPSFPAEARSFTIKYTVNIPTIEFVYRLLVALLVAFLPCVVIRSRCCDYSYASSFFA